MKIGNRKVGESEPLFVIAEIGLNHGGSVDRALALVDAAAAAGASAVKLQTLIASELVAPGAPAPAHVAATSLRDFFAPLRARRGRASSRRRDGRANAGWRSWRRRSRRRGRHARARRRRRLQDRQRRHHLGRLIAAARTGKPLVISTGMSALDEIARALTWARSAGAVGHRAAALRVGVSGAARAARTCARSRRWRRRSACRSVCPTTAPTPSPCRWPSRSARRSTSATSCSTPATARSTRRCRARRPSWPQLIRRGRARAGGPRAPATRCACRPKAATSSASRRALYAPRALRGRTPSSRPPISSRCGPASAWPPIGMPSWSARACIATSTPGTPFVRRPIVAWHAARGNRACRLTCSSPPASRRVPLVQAFQRALSPVARRRRRRRHRRQPAVAGGLRRRPRVSRAAVDRSRLPRRRS